jgi:alkylation response protein AidB-like acyl-CoA dehydrogenase
MVAIADGPYLLRRIRMAVGGEREHARMDERAKTDCVANARALAPVILAAAPRIEANRELLPDLVAALHEARLFRMLVPRSLGGEELSPVEYVQAIEEIAKADASTAWCIAQTSVCSTISSCLKPETAAEIFKKNPRGILAWGPLGKNARAVAEKGGFRVTGTWPFASGSRHATWLAAHSPVYEPDGQPRRDANGNPVEMTFVFPRECATISDVWHVIGLKGTGSDTYALNDLFVTEDRAITALARNPAERRERGALYSFTVYQLFGSSFAAIALGIARSTLDAFVALAQAKTPTGYTSLLRDNAVIQSQVGVAQSQLAAARVFFLHALEEIWQAAQSGTTSIDHRVRLRMASAHASHQARQVVDTAYHAAGATAIFESNPFERRFRDAHAVSQQVQSHFSVFEAIGRYFLGLPPGTRLI